MKRRGFVTGCLSAIAAGAASLFAGKESKAAAKLHSVTNNHTQLTGATNSVDKGAVPEEFRFAVVWGGTFPSIRTVRPELIRKAKYKTPYGGDCWFESLPRDLPNVDNDKVYPRPPQFLVSHEIFVGTAEEIVEHIRAGVYASAAMMWEGRGIHATDDELAKQQSELARLSGSHIRQDYAPEWRAVDAKRAAMDANLP